MEWIIEDMGLDRAHDIAMVSRVDLDEGIVSKMEGWNQEMVGNRWLLVFWWMDEYTQQIVFEKNY